MKSNYCKVYLSTVKPLNELEESVKRILKSNLIGFYIDENEEYDSEKEKEFPDGFLYFKYMIELHFPDDFPKNECITIINELLKDFWKDEIPSIASYDYENELIEDGGYRSKEIPWPK